MKLNARATFPQMEYARRLGIDFPPDITQGEIHLLINQRARKKSPPPSALLVRIAEKFNLDFNKPGMSQHYLGDLIVDTLITHFSADDVIEHEGDVYTIRTISEMDDTWVVHLKSHETGRVQRRSILTIALAEHVAKDA